MTLKINKLSPYILITIVATGCYDEQPTQTRLLKYKPVIYSRDEWPEWAKQNLMKIVIDENQYIVPSKNISIDENGILKFKTFYGTVFITTNYTVSDWKLPGNIKYFTPCVKPNIWHMVGRPNSYSICPDCNQTISNVLY